MTLATILNLIPLAVDAFGAVSKEVIELKAASGLSDEELLAAAAAKDAQTLAAVQAHIDALTSK